MSDLLKNMYNSNSLRRIAETIQSAYAPFPVEEFLQATMDATWEDLELKARIRKISTTMGQFLPADYSEALAVLDQIAAACQESFSSLFFPDFVEVFGQAEEHWDLSIAALARYTPYSSSEFAVRPFIIKQEDRMMAQMYIWSKDENEHIRRLASEGSRPQLPWGQALNSFKKDPTPVLPILEQLKADPSLYVRKSVANNLNDISKTHPELVAKLAREWYGTNEYTNWIVKHGCRTLLKKGNRDVLAIFGFAESDCIDVDGFSLESASATIGEDLVFSFHITAKAAARVRLEYGIEYVKANGKTSRKIFQISELSMDRGIRKPYTKTHSLADRTTRKHYPGMHSIALIVNGVEREVLNFSVIKS